VLTSSEPAPIGIVDVGLGNVASIKRMLEKLGGRAEFLSDPSQLSHVSKIILPGVGHFDEGVRRLTDSGFAQAIPDFVAQGNRWVLGICLGMQLLCHSSEEGDRAGLGLVDAHVHRFRFDAPTKLKVPHMGWNVVRPTRPSALFADMADEYRFYFVHSFKVVPVDPSITTGVTAYGDDFCCAFERDRVLGVQFHPEKSHRFGMALMRGFVEL